MTKKELARRLIQLLEEAYPDAICSLNYAKPYELLFATRLAAQCTDARVNLVTPILFSRYPTLEAIAGADISELSDIIHSCGFFNSKARDIIACANKLICDFGGEVPSGMDDLLSLPGVGRKTANLIRGDVFGLPSVVVDTHCMRITRRMGLTDELTPEKIEANLWDILPHDKAGDFCHRLVLHGRDVCAARAPKCGECICTDICKKRLSE